MPVLPSADLVSVLKTGFFGPTTPCMKGFGQIDVHYCAAPLSNIACFARYRSSYPLFNNTYHTRIIDILYERRVITVIIGVKKRKNEDINNLFQGLFGMGEGGDNN